MDKYARMLKKKGLKVTRPRQEILRYLDEHRCHPSANGIYSALKKKNPSLSKTTVYNSLDVLAKNDLVQMLTILGTEAVYDFKDGVHHHFLCKGCGKIYDIEVQCPYLQGINEGENVIEEVHGYFKGTCKECVEK